MVPTIRWPPKCFKSPPVPLKGVSSKQKINDKTWAETQPAPAGTAYCGGHRYRKNKQFPSHARSPEQDPGVTTEPPPTAARPPSLRCCNSFYQISPFLLHIPLSSLSFFFPPPQPKGKERKGNISTTIACQAPVIFKPSSPLPFNSPYLAENFPSLKLSLISGSSSFLSLSFSPN